MNPPCLKIEDLSIPVLLQGLRLAREAIHNGLPLTADEILLEMAVALTTVECLEQSKYQIHQ